MEENEDAILEGNEYRNKAYEILQHYKFGRMSLDNCLDELCGELPKEIKKISEDITEKESPLRLPIELGGKNLEEGYEIVFEIKISNELREKVSDAAKREETTFNGYVMGRVAQIFEQETKVIPVNESIPFMMDDHSELEKIISEVLEKEGVDFTELRKEKKVGYGKYGDNGFWLEEYMALVCWCSYINLPIKNRIEWLSKFFGRTELQIQDLLSVHIYFMNRKNKTKEEEEYTDAYVDLWINYSWEIGGYFNKYHKYTFQYKYKGEKEGINSLDQVF